MDASDRSAVLRAYDTFGVRTDASRERIGVRAPACCAQNRMTSTEDLASCDAVAQEIPSRKRKLALRTHGHEKLPLTIAVLNADLRPRLGLFRPADGRLARAGAARESARLRLLAAAPRPGVLVVRQQLVGLFRSPGAGGIVGELA